MEREEGAAGAQGHHVEGRGEGGSSGGRAGRGRRCIARDRGRGRRRHRERRRARGIFFVAETKGSGIYLVLGTVDRTKPDLDVQAVIERSKIFLLTWLEGGAGE